MTYLLILLFAITFDSGVTHSGPKDIVYGQSNFSYQLFVGKRATPSRTNRLLVITEVEWCQPCRQLEPVLKELKKQGYDIHEYTQAQWVKAKGKPEGIPQTVIDEKNRIRVPTLFFVEVDEKTNKIKHWKRGWSPIMGDNAAYIKRHLTK